MLDKTEELAINSSHTPEINTENTNKNITSISLVEQLLAKASSPQEALGWGQVRELILQQNEDVIEEPLAKASSPQEALEWVKVRELVLRQNEEAKQANHRRFLRKTRLIYGISLCSTAFVAGVVLFICGYQDSIYLIVAGLIPLVPNINNN